MSKRRPFSEPGAHRPAMDNTCGHDAGITNGPHCGRPATLHLFAGSPDTGPGEWSTVACGEHAPVAKALAWDWHDMSGVCDVPGTLWQSGQHQGEGFCFWPEEEAAIHEAVRVEMVKP